MEKEAENVLVRHFDEHQRSFGFKASDIEGRVAQLYDDLLEVELGAKIGNVSLSGDTPKEHIDLNKVISRTLIHFLDCSLTTDSTPDAKESVEALQELVVAVAAQRVDVANDLLHDRLVPLSAVLLERIRSTACRCIGLTVKFLCNGKLAKEELESLLDTSSQALIPRFTDKAQSVRYAAVEASRFFFGGSSNNNDLDDPDIRQSLQWSIQHDPSVNNRVAALGSLPVTLQTVDVILTRVRDVKAKVRVAAVQTLRANVPDVFKWEAEQCAELVEAGWSDRCSLTKAEIEKIVLDWFRGAKFDAVELLRHLNVVHYEESCRTIMNILLKASDDLLSEHFNESDALNYRRGLSISYGASFRVNQAVEVERVFFLHTKCLHAEKLESRLRDLTLSEILPDIPDICEAFELHASALMKAIVEEKDFDTTNRLVSICLHLLSMVKSADIEEGSRLHLRSTMKAMIESIVTPEDLVEGCIETLQRTERIESDFWDISAGAVESLSTQDDDDGLSDNRLLRILSILSIVLERSSSRLALSDKVQYFAEHIVPSVSNSNGIVREAAVACFGKIGLFTEEDKVISEYKPILLEVALNENEILAIRAQALLGLSDWSMLYMDTLTPLETEESSASLQDVILELMVHSELSLACVAAEVACKLLIRTRVCDVSWLAHLLIFFFDPRLVDGEDIEDDSKSKEVGGPVRLQQILTQFFPLYYLRSQPGRDAFFSCVVPCLEMATSKALKKKRGAKAFPIAKMLDFILSTAVEAESTRNVEPINGEQSISQESSPFLKVSIQVARFLSDKNDELGVATQRTLAKVLGTTVLDLERENLNDLKVLADIMEELGTEFDDETTLGHFAMLNDVLDEVDFSAKSMRDAHGADAESLTQAMDKIFISPTKVAMDKENTHVEHSTGAATEKNETPVPHRSHLSFSTGN